MPDEPFNEHFAEWSADNPDYLSRVHDQASLDCVLDELFATYRGIKVLSYQLDPDELSHLVLRTELRVVFISRRNLLRTAVSDRIAKQTNVYNRWDIDAGRSITGCYESLAPLDVEDLRRYVRDLASHLRWVTSVLDRRPDGSVLRLDYDDLFLADREAQHDQLVALWTFLGVTPLNSSAIRDYLDPSAARLAGPDTYGRLPNAGEIDAALGADDTGRLLPFDP